MSDHTLVVMRHAKSSWDVQTTDDLRPLSARGRRDGLAAGRHLIDRGLHPDLVLCSPALRAAETWDQLSAAGVSAREVRAVEVLYEGFAPGVVAELRGLPETVGTVLVIGHLPLLDDVVHSVAAHEATPVWRAVDAKFPTSAIAVIACEGRWSALGPHAARLVDFVVPRG